MNSWKGKEEEKWLMTALVFWGAKEDIDGDQVGDIDAAVVDVDVSSPLTYNNNPLINHQLVMDGC